MDAPQRATSGESPPRSARVALPGRDVIDRGPARAPLRRGLPNAPGDGYALTYRASRLSLREDLGGRAVAALVLGLGLPPPVIAPDAEDAAGSTGRPGHAHRRSAPPGGGHPGLP